MASDLERAISAAHQAQLNFLLVEISSGIALTKFRHPSARVCARTAYNVAVRSLRRATLPEAEREKVLAALQRLKRRLEELGETF